MFSVAGSALRMRRWRVSCAPAGVTTGWSRLSCAHRRATSDQRLQPRTTRKANETYGNQNGAARTAEDAKAVEFEDLKRRIHGKLVDKLDLTQSRRTGRRRAAPRNPPGRRALCDTEDTLLNRNERERLVEEVLDETFGLGPLELLLKDPTISDILINGPKHIYVERRGKMEKTTVTFRDNNHLMQIIDRIVSKVGRRVDEVCPMVDARLPDGSRVNAIIPPLALDGAAVSIRRFGSNPLKLEDLLNYKAFTPEMVMLLEGAIKARLNIIISGGTGSGKTTLLNTLSSFISDHDRIVTIEDAAELQLQQEHVVRLETRPPNIEGKGADHGHRPGRATPCVCGPNGSSSASAAVPETLDMLQAMNTGHEGSMTTIHANTPRDALARIETMITMAGFELPLKAMRQQIASAVDLIIQANRLQGGPRKITHITEIWAWNKTRSSCRTSITSCRTASTKTAGLTAASRPPASARDSWTAWNRPACGCRPAPSANGR